MRLAPQNYLLFLVLVLHWKWELQVPIYLYKKWELQALYTISFFSFSPTLNNMEFFNVVANFLFWFFNLVISVHCINFNVSVSLDGSKDFGSINDDAIAAAPDNSNTRFYIRVTPGTYHERLQIPTSKTFIALIGDN